MADTAASACGEGPGDRDGPLTGRRVCGCVWVAMMGGGSDTTTPAWKRRGRASAATTCPRFEPGVSILELVHFD
jgi:hypothetical protein|eukprot:COSAG01_NODE_5105_length_4478_cov_119.856588_6_plen_74_part_00